VLTPLKEMTLAVYSGPALVMPQSVEPVEPRLSPIPNVRRLRIRTEKLSQGERCRAAAATSSAPLAEHPVIPHSTETLAPARSEMRPAQGRLSSVAMYWMLMTSPASAALKPMRRCT
jgi:hypothetical protein